MAFDGFDKERLEEIRYRIGYYFNTRTGYELGTGVVYFAANESMPGFYKIGFTKQPPKQRMRQLTQGLPSPWHVVTQGFFLHPRKGELALHNHFAPYRYNREFFRAIPEDLFAEVLGSAQQHLNSAVETYASLRILPEVRRDVRKLRTLIYWQAQSNASWKS